MVVSGLGSNLSILIKCDYVAHHHWMAFLCWYSISKNLPDARVTISVNRNLMDLRLFDWARKCKIPLKIISPTTEEGHIEVALENKLVSVPLLVLEPDTVCVHDFNETGFSTGQFTDSVWHLGDIDGLGGNCRMDKTLVFATYPDGWGKFVTSEWINSVSCPFVRDRRYYSTNMTINERAIAKLWNAAELLYQAIGI